MALLGVGWMAGSPFWGWAGCRGPLLSVRGLQGAFIECVQVAGGPFLGMGGLQGKELSVPWSLIIGNVLLLVLFLVHTSKSGRNRWMSVG